jgi:FRG domain
MKDVERFERGHKSGWLFRGHRCPEWKLETSLERASRRCGVSEVDYERAVWREFRRHAHSYLSRVPSETDTLEWLALMQHYGAPTRLLDFTESFWISLYFAIEDAESDCAVVALDRQSLKKKRAALNYNEVLRANIDRGADADDFLYEDVPFYTNDRLAIQKGIFVFSLNLQRKFHDLLLQNQKVFKQLIVSATLFPEIRKRLNDFNCNSRVLFPGIDGYGRYFRNHTF